MPGPPGAHQVMALVHVHTTASDGAATAADIARAAAKAGVEVVVLTDHDRLSPGAGWQDGAFLVAGQEISPRHNHILALGQTKALPKMRGDGVNGDPARSLAQARRAGAWTALAHPLDPAMTMSGRSRSFVCLDFSALDAPGLELWNAMSAFKEGVSGPIMALARILMPRAFLSPPHPLLLSLWDTVGRGRRWTGLGGGDAHGFKVGPRWLGLRVFSYRLHMRLILTGLWLSMPLTGDDSADLALVRQAFNEGRAFACLGNARGFACWLEGPDGSTRLPGAEEPWRPGWRLRVRLPAWGRARLIRHGRVEAQAQGRGFTWPLDRPGVWRVEAQRLRFPAGWRPWIYCNPFLLREAA